MDKTTLFNLLDSLYILQACGAQCDANTLALRHGYEREEVLAGLQQLERKGLVDAAAARLTLRGLAAATALHGHKQSAQSHAA